MGCLHQLSTHFTQKECGLVCSHPGKKQTTCPACSATTPSSSQMRFTAPSSVSTPQWVGGCVDLTLSSLQLCQLHLELKSSSPAAAFGLAAAGRASVVRDQWFAVTALITQVCTQPGSFSCSRRVVIRQSTSEHRDQAVKQAAGTRGLHLLCLPTFPPLGDRGNANFHKRRGFKVGEGRQRVMTCEQYTSDRGTCCPKAFSNVENI